MIEDTLSLEQQGLKILRTYSQGGRIRVVRGKRTISRRVKGEGGKTS